MGEYSININADYVNVDEISEQAPELYPNPVNDILNIPDDVKVISFCDVNGKKIELEFDTKTDLSRILPGIYLLMYEYKGSVYTDRIIKL